MTHSVALVTGASRGVGRGVANALAEHGLHVFATGRTIGQADLRPDVERIVCDHTDDGAVERAFERVVQQASGVDVLVNNAWPGYERMVEGGRFTWALPFWEQPRWRWDAMMTGGVRSAFVASQLAAPFMIAAGRGLIVNVSVWAAKKYIGNTLYGVAKAATDKLTHDTAHELRDRGVAVVSLYPGLVRTEAVVAARVFDLSNSESPEFIGRAVLALWNDPELLVLSGSTQVAAELGERYGFTDVDGQRPRPLTLADV
jgi:NAD(P)-dependent dehydrogenase (short-subunit alcohol dehydrogenase family)